MNRKAFWIVAVLALCCGAQALVDLCWQPGYALRSGLKLALFAGGMGLCLVAIGDTKAIAGLYARRSMKTAVFLSGGVFTLVLGAFFLFRPFIDLNAITASLLGTGGVTRENFLWVALYISIVNSGLEELFFRGFGYLILRRHWDEDLASLLSAAAFALYHVSIIRGWFGWWIYGLCMTGLFIGGLLFNWLDREGSLLPGWLVHASANLAINAVGLIMFGYL